METITLNLPDFWATALFYDDVSEFKYEDEKQFQEFCLWMQKHYGTSEPVAMDEEPSFSKYHDATQFGVLACNVHEYTFVVGGGNPNTAFRLNRKHYNNTMWLEHCGHDDFRLFDMPPTKPQGFSYDFKSLWDALIYAKNNNIKVEVRG